jgi:hypothetical protein
MDVCIKWFWKINSGGLPEYKKGNGTQESPTSPSICLTRKKSKRTMTKTDIS